MKIVFILLWLLVFAFGCMLGLIALDTINTSEQIQKSPYVPENVTKQTDNTNTFIRVKVITYDNLEDLNESYKQYIISQGGDVSSIPKVYGWARWSNAPTQFCVIHVLEPSTTFDRVFNTWGHELAHCVYGRFHN